MNDNTHTTSDLLYAAANQLEIWKIATRMIKPPPISEYRANYLEELIPELRDRAHQLEQENR